MQFLPPHTAFLPPCCFILYFFILLPLFFHPLCTVCSSCCCWFWFPLYSFCHCAFPWFLAACLPFLTLMSPPILFSLWSCQPSRVEQLCFPIHSSAAWLLFKLTFFGFLAIGSSCCHFSSGTKVNLFEEQAKTEKNLAGQEQGKMRSREN